MPYAITQIGWREIGDGWALAEGESLAESIPEWLLEAVELQRVEMAARSELGTKLAEANEVVQPLQDDFDIDEITDTDLAKWRIWKKYRSALGKTPEREGWPASPDWPAAPEI
jgi:hypothetical protein